jgi:phytoene/squalene synthetase
MVRQARALLASGERLEALVPRPLRLQLALYRMGGLAICDAIEALGYRTEHERPSLSTPTKVSVVLRAAVESFSRRPA